MNSEKGFTLVEVLAGTVILSIILVSTAQLMIQSNKTAEINKEQLTVIHLTNAMLERLKIENQFIKNALPASNTWDTCINIPLKNESEDYSTVKVNNETYSISACLTPRNNTNPIVKENINLVNVKVSVQDQSGKRKSEIEGYVPL